MNFNFFKCSVIFTISIFFSCNNHEITKIEKKEEPKIEKKQEKIIITDFSAGEEIFRDNCMICHQKTGLGIENTYPPLAGSDFLINNKIQAIKIIINGSKVPVIVNGVKYPGGIMTSNELNNQQVVDVMNYILNSWDNKGGFVTIGEVKKALKKK